MLHLCGLKLRLCDGLSRREFLRVGQVYGSSDASAAYPAGLPVSPDNLAATVFHGLGISSDREIRDSQGRSLPLCNGKRVLGLF